MLKGQMQHIDILKRHLIKIILGNISYNFISSKNHLIDEGDTINSIIYKVIKSFVTLKEEYG
jgi:hypothetical protein